MDLNVLSTEFVKVRVNATKLGVTYNPTGDVVYLAFKLVGDTPDSGDWVAGTWETTPTAYLARAVVGPMGDITLGSGEYVVWVKITDDPEVPVLQAGALSVYTT